MPYPSQINAETILHTAREMIATDGVDHLSLNKLASAMGVKAPSLYRYYNSKTALLRAVNEDTMARLLEALQPALALDVSPFDRSMEVARRYRQFAHDNAAVYGMLFTNTLTGLHIENEFIAGMIGPFVRMMALVCGDDCARSALRGFLALAHGFVMMELADQFNQSLDPLDVYESSMRAYLHGWEAA
ncbi:MAG: TetR/AcrR family transcriptional regulator [Chloroflexota bacterium]